MKSIRIATLLFLFYLPSCSGDSYKERKLFSKIKVGMTSNEVIKVLGIPDDTTYSVVDSSEFCFYFFTKNKSGMRSSLPVICFNKNKKVEIVSYGE